MNNKDIRHQNFLELLKGYKSQRAFADRCNLSPGFVSQMNNRTRNIGDAVAADIETALGLPHGWMDQLHYDGQVTADGTQTYGAEPQQALTPELSAMQSRFDAASPQTQKMIMDLLEAEATGSINHAITSSLSNLLNALKQQGIQAKDLETGTGALYEG